MATAKPKEFERLTSREIKAIEKKPGGSNVAGRDAGDGPFAGTQPNTFPIKTLDNAKSALNE